MKPWQIPIKKAPNKWGNKEQRERIQVWAKKTKPKVGHKGVKEQIMF